MKRIKSETMKVKNVNKKCNTPEEMRTILDNEFCDRDIYFFYIDIIAYNCDTERFNLKIRLCRFFIVFLVNRQT